ncbi:MAG: hypothetical protein A2W33_00285 [Chloroflexi bacterium RBG_16_52_11]|nr:MAG: hypothetical protein A2W33_00285 [Chloroflexi bacterium RBG_16_52_11]
MSAKLQRNTKILAILTLAAFVGLVSSFLLVDASKATPGSGVTSEVIARGDTSESIRAKFKDGFHTDTHVDQIVVVRFTVTPGGVFGWHQHGGPIWVVVTSGTLTYYDAEDPSCTPINYPAGSAFMDPGNHTHNARNEGSVDLVTYATLMMPEGAQVRIDAPDPGICDF